MAKNLELFTRSAPKPAEPLAEKLRPKSFADFENLEALEKSVIDLLVEGQAVPPSFVLWGPPGSGKTTLARLVGNKFDCNFVEFSAVLNGVKEVREVVAEAKHSSKPTVLFVDEIHRFNKGQQDAFLPHVESGAIVLIGATTENPSFYLNQALLSRVRVVVLPSLPKDALLSILDKAIAALSLRVSEGGKGLMVEFAGGDARRLLNLVESLARSEKGEITEDTLRAHLKNARTVFYDREGEEHYNMVSAFIKSMRGSNADAALYWGFRMLEGGEDPRFLIRRMIIFASEDIGNSDPRALSVAVATLNAFEHIGLPEGKIPIAQCITYLATAPKSNRSYEASCYRSIPAPLRERTLIVGTGDAPIDTLFLKRPLSEDRIEEALMRFLAI